MPIRYGNAMGLLLLLAVAGCQHALPVRTEPAHDLGAEIRRLPPIDASSTYNLVTEASQTAEVSLVGYEEPEDVPAPIVKAAEKTLAVLSLADLEQIATQSNPTLSAARAKIEAARGQQIQAGLYPNPVLGYHAMEIGNLDTAGQQGAFASQRFITGGKLDLDQAIAGRQIEEERVKYHAQVQRVLSDVRVRYYEALVAQRRVELATELTKIGDNLVAAGDKLLAGRIGTENDLLQAQIRAEESEIELENAINEYQAAWQRLTATLGQPCMAVCRLEGKLDANLPDYDMDDCCQMVFEANPELAAARIRVERAGISLRRSEIEPIPDVDVLVSVRHNNITQYDVANVQVGMPIPVFNKNQGNIRSADAEWIYANREVERIELDLRDRLAVTYQRYANAKQQVLKYRDQILTRASKSLDLVTAGYEQGQVEYLTLLTAQETFIRANLSYLNSLQELRTAASLIENQLLSESLSSR